MSNLFEHVYILRSLSWLLKNIWQKIMKKDKKKNMYGDTLRKEFRETR